jgi:hypothetical protein
MRVVNCCVSIITWFSNFHDLARRVMIFHLFSFSFSEDLLNILGTHQIILIFFIHDLYCLWFITEYEVGITFNEEH